jgi:Na+-driven multidrug efflux pump
VTILYCLLIPYGRQFGTILDSMGKPSLTFRVVLVCALINVGLNYLLIHRYGVIGAAYATLGANIIGFFIGQVILRRELGVNLGHTFLYAARFYPEMAGRLMHALRRPKP